MNTAFLLMAMYAGRPIIPADDVAKDFFGLTTDKFIRKVSAGDIALPLVRMEASQKCAKGVHLNDLALYLDERRAAAIKECQQLQGKGRQ
ncbi:pyocin activator PrtN family protein [Corticibacterium sp. UT-5YL-CI-8]|nr:pyocin activator PrtN family protein [Tianweitania sp. UT-5YL-CI-8]